jgi:hypothetical protein
MNFIGTIAYVAGATIIVMTLGWLVGLGMLLIAVGHNIERHS